MIVGILILSGILKPSPNITSETDLLLDLQWMVPGQAGVLGESAVRVVEEVGGGGTAAALLLSTGVDPVLGRLSRLMSAGMVAAMVGITSYQVIFRDVCRYLDA